MKKTLLITVLIFSVLACVQAKDFHIRFGVGEARGALETLPDAMGGIFPGYFRIGAGYTGFNLLPERTTELKLIGGFGVQQRKLWQNPVTGEVIDNYEPAAVNALSAEWDLSFAQGFFTSPVYGKDFLTAKIGYSGRYEKYMGDTTFLYWTLPANLDRFTDSKVYSDVAGGKFLGNEINLSLKLDDMEDTLHTNDGWYTTLDFKFGPSFMNKALDGKASYVTGTFNAVGAKTLLNLTNSQNNRSMFSIVLIDRLNGWYVGGKEVPTFIQRAASMGRRMRGYAFYSYVYKFSFVNNLEFRFTAPGIHWDGLAPRAALFFDVGYGLGNHVNTSSVNASVSNQLLMSLGGQIELSFFDFVDIGFQVSYLLKGENLLKEGKKVTTAFFLTLDY